MSDGSSEAYYLIKRQIETFPEFAQLPEVTDTEAQWLGHSAALVERLGKPRDKLDWNMSMSALTGLFGAKEVGRLRIILYRMLSTAELSMPQAVRDAFIPAGTPYDAFVALKRVLERAKTSVYVEDPYLSATVLSDFIDGLNPDLSVHLLGALGRSKADLKPAVERWRAQGKVPNIQVRLVPNEALHDRWIILDDGEAWSSSQSLGSLAKNRPAFLMKAEQESAELKRQHALGLWKAGSPL